MLNPGILQLCFECFNRKKQIPHSCVYLLFTVRDVTDTAPGKGLVGVELAVGAVDVKTLSVHAE